MHKRVFNDAELLVNLEAPLSEHRPWNKQLASRLDNVYIGQLKLLAVELAFLTLGVSDTSNCVVVYAGAAGGHHIPALAEQFPELQFYLYDPAPFAIQETPQLRINYMSSSGFFTDEIARVWAQRSDLQVLFISDVRTSGDTSEEHESEVEANMHMQARWVELLRPSLRAYSLKFRIPYPIIEANKPFVYLGGKLIYQPFPKKDSMELRLIGNKADATAGSEAVSYDSHSLEEIVFYHNSVIRPNRRLYYNIFTGDSRPYSDPQFDNGYDCTYLLYCVLKLQQRIGDDDSQKVLGIVRRMIEITSQGRWSLKDRQGGTVIYRGQHGDFQRRLGVRPAK